MPGTEVSGSHSGWSNSKLLLDFLDTHFKKFCPEHNKPILILYDGHASHVATPVIHWAREHNMVLFVLPPHTSHITQSLDVGCFGPIKRVFYAECKAFMAANPGSVITHYNLVSLICKAHSKALTIKNITSSFKKSGVYPFDKDAITEEQLEPSFAVNISETSIQPPSSVSSVSDLLRNKVPHSVAGCSTRKRLSFSAQKRRGGTAITEEHIEPENIQSRSQAPKSKNRKRKSVLSELQNVSDEIIPLPGPSNLNNVTAADPPSDNEDTPPRDEELCCQCRKWAPPGLKNMPGFTTVKWAQCCKSRPRCRHWVHLRFCVPVMDVTEEDKFFCPCCV